MEPWQSWAAAICIGGAAFLYYTKDSKYFMKARETRTPSISEQQPQSSSTRRRQDKQTPRRKDNGQAATYAEAAASGASKSPSGPSKKRKAPTRPSAPRLAPTQTAVQAEDAEDNDVAYEDNEWAKQLNASKKGVSLASSKSPGKQRGGQNQQQLNGTIQNSLPQTDISAGSASNNGVSKQRDVAPAGGDVSDMLEPRAPGPSVVRVTGEVQEAKKSQSPRPAPVQETKKQRQNRKKAEEKRLQREEDEKQRQVLLENQRRAARQARGEPAKNGLAQSKAPSSSAWTAPSQSSATTNGAGLASGVEPRANEPLLLDTFDQDALSTSSSNELHTDSTTPATVISGYDQGLPSEEVQLEMLNQINQNSGWSEVSTKTKKGKKKAQTPAQAPLSPTSSSGKDSNPYSAVSTNDLVNGSAKPTPTTTTTKSKPQANGFAALATATDYTPGVKGHPDDSDWAVF